MNRKDGLFAHHNVGALVTPFLHVFLSSYGIWEVETILLQRGLEPSRFGRYGCIFQNHFAGIRHSWWVRFLLNESMQRNCFSPLTRFSNGRKRKLRPIHSFDQGGLDRARGCQRVPPPTFQERRVAMDDLTPPGHTGPPTRGRASDRSC